MNDFQRNHLKFFVLLVLAVFTPAVGAVSPYEVCAWRAMSKTFAADEMSCEGLPADGVIMNRSRTFTYGDGVSFNDVALTSIPTGEMVRFIGVAKRNNRIDTSLIIHSQFINCMFGVMETAQACHLERLKISPGASYTLCETGESVLLYLKGLK